MKRDFFTTPLDLGHELAIDNFAGGGGASTGIALGLGREVDIAINHDGEALAMHAANHPTSAHYREDVFSVHPGFVTNQMPIGLAWFSPDCKHFSKAKGKKPVDKKIRGLAWVTLKWAAFQVPRVIMLENVEEFQDWGPIDADGKPIKEEKGRTFKAFILALTSGIPADHPDLEEIYTVLGHDFPIARLQKGLGYRVEWRVLRACDYGTPTIRKRLFLIARRDGNPIVWPTPTHGDPKSEAVKTGKRLPWRTAAECIDWSIPCPSIFERKRPLKDATLARIAKGIMKFVVNSDNPFIVPGATLTAPTITRIGQTGGGGSYSNSIEDPLRTIVSKNEHLLVVPHISKMRTGSVGSDAGDPLHTVTAGGQQERPGTGNAMGLVSAFLAKHYTGVVGSDMDDPVSTVTSVDHNSLVTANLVRQFGNSDAADVAAPVGTICAGGGGKTQLVASSLVKLRGTSTAAATDAPLHTISAGGTHHAEVRAFLVKYYSEGGQWQALSDPMHTIPTKDRIGLVTIQGEDYAIVDIGMRMLTPRELARAQGFPDSYILDPEVNGRPLPKSAQVRMIGNSVCPTMAKVLVEANFTHERQIQRAA